MTTCTIPVVMSWRPCGCNGSDDGTNYTEARVARLFAGRERLTALDVLALDIPADDRLWAVLRPELIPERDLHELACRFAERVLPLFEAAHPHDSRPRAVIEAKRAWLRGEISDAELAAARDAAWAAWAASDAAWDAASDAAWAAARVSERAERDAQVQMVRDYLVEVAE